MICSCVAVIQMYSLLVLLPMREWLLPCCHIVAHTFAKREAAPAFDGIKTRRRAWGKYVQASTSTCHHREEAHET